MISFKPKAHPTKFMNIGQMIDPKITLHDPPRNYYNEFAQNHCLSCVLFGVNHNNSQTMTVDMYNQSQHSIMKYHNNHPSGRHQS